MQSLDAILGALGWIPIWLWVAIGALIIGAAVKFFGWRGAIPAAVVTFAVAVLAAVRRGGWEAREKSGAENVKKVVEQARKARAESDRRNADPKRLREDDGYRRD